MKQKNQTQNILSAKILVIISILLFDIGTFAQAESVFLDSPDGRIVFSLDYRQFTYRIEYDDQILINDSPLGFRLKNQPNFSGPFRLTGEERRRIDRTTPWRFGKSSALRNYCNEMHLDLQETGNSGRQLQLRVRVYNDGAAFRFHFPEQEHLAGVSVQSEDTGFNLSEGLAWVLDVGKEQTPYEANYQQLRLAEIRPEQLIALPFLVKLDNGKWLAIAEADIENYPAMFLRRSIGEYPGLHSHLARSRADSTLCARFTPPHSLPWRVFMIADHPGKMIESDLILNLSRETRLTVTDWIQPGKAAWPWWNGRMVDDQPFSGGMNTATMKYYIDFAAAAGLPYLLIDAGWYGPKINQPTEDITTTIPEIDLPEIIAYGKQRQVGILLWVYWECVRDQMERAFPLYEKWGVKGIKIDYMNCADQEMVNFYPPVLQKAAEHHLIVDLHGSHPPDGLRRRFPNLLTRESVLGLEWNKWSDKCSPQHQVTIPFTRMLVGPMDFTPGTFHVANCRQFVAREYNPMGQGTRAHHLAMYVVYESPLQMVVGSPKSLLGQPGFEFIRQVPTVWDETRFISGEVGEFIILARRSGRDWYIGGMSNWDARETELLLSFLGGGTSRAQIFRDGAAADEDPNQLEIVQKVVSSGDVLHLRMASGGGFALVLQPVE
ncbi:MAG: glycoside hydrolase family 97 protein [Calditrichia bacterium]